ncbi:MAG: hypothetical protein WCB31_09730 [Nitrososphaeraceae archaeon]
MQETKRLKNGFNGATNEHISSEEMNIAHVISMNKYISSIYSRSKKLNDIGF